GRGPCPFRPWRANGGPWPPRQRRRQRGRPRRPPWAWPVPVWRRGPSSALGTLDRIRPALLAGRARSPEGVDRRTSVLILVATANPPIRAGVALIAALRYEIHVVIGDVQHVEPTLIGRV